MLREEVSRRIAAGEVIDRPLSIVRELIDNSIDSGASSIDVEIVGGGITEVRIRDDGVGMTRDDLELSVRPHATSKISSIEDLNASRTLGFRGEALSSIAAVSRLEITSRAFDEESVGNRIVVHAGTLKGISPDSIPSGTIVSAKDLFYSLPARRKFLKRPSTEANRCAQIAVEKALPHPGISFNIMVDGKNRVSLPHCGSRKERVSAAFHRSIGSAPLYEATTDAGRLNVESVIADPSLHRGDRRLVQIFVNNRRIEEFSLVQAALYATAPYFPGGRFPVAVVFVEIDPSEIDVNIHPAKREIRFRNPSEAHRAVVDSVAEAAQQFGFRAPRLSTGSTLSTTDPAPARPELSNRGQYTRDRPEPVLDLTHARESGTSYRVANDSRDARVAGPALQREGQEIVYHGQLFSLFLLVESEETLFIIDQHAAHERLIFDLLRSRPVASQPLLVPIRMDPVTDDPDHAEGLIDRLQELGVRLEVEEESWYLTALPSSPFPIERSLVRLIERYKGGSEGLVRGLFANSACRSAVKEMDILDETAATDLARRALSLPEPRCPHGRPVWVEITRSELFELVGRT